MVSSVGSSAATMAPPAAASASKSKATDPGQSFLQTVDNYLQNSSSGVNGPNSDDADSSADSTASQTTSNDLMSSLLQMQESASG